MTPRFEWDVAKNRANGQKHGVSFVEAQSVFYDEDAILIADPDHSEREERFIMLGLSFNSRVLIICHCCREAEAVIRIISARRATPRERAQYELLR